MPIIGFDFNGVLADAFEGTRRALEIVTGLAIDREKYLGKVHVERETQFLCRRSPNQARPITLNDWNKAKRLVYGPRFFELNPPNTKVVRLAQRLACLGYEIHIVSTCHGVHRDRAWEWANRNNLGISGVHNRVENKFPLFSRMDAVVDDDPKKLIGLPPEVRSILYWRSGKPPAVPSHVHVANDAIGIMRAIRK